MSEPSPSPCVPFVEFRPHLSPTAAGDCLPCSYFHIPQRLQNYDDPISHSMMRPSLPENWDDLDEDQQNRKMEPYRRRFIHYYYVKNTEQYNKLNYVALMDPMAVLCRRLFVLLGREKPSHQRLR